MELEKHVLSAIDDYALGKADSALMHACIAIDGTAKNAFSKNKVGKSDYKKCIRSYYWIIEQMIGEGLNLEETKFKNVEIDNGHGGIIKDPDLADIIYHIFRCSHAHCTSVPLNYELLPVSDGYSCWILADGIIRMPERVIWALLAVSVFSKANKALKTNGNYFLSWGSEQLGIEKFIIKDWWGREDDLKTFFTNHNNSPRIKLEGLEDFRPCVRNPTFK